LESAVDIYGKLLIAVFSFIAPSMTLLIGLFGTGITMYRRKSEDFLKQSEDLVTNPGNLPGTSNDKKIGLIKDRIKNLDLIKKEMERDNNLLSPKRQVRRIFMPLLLSTVLLIVYYYTNEEDLKGLAFVRIDRLSLFLSFGLLFYVITVLWQIFCKIVEVKCVIEIENKDGNVNNVDFK
jgi:hypothetical protein